MGLESCVLSSDADALSVRLQPQLAGSGWLGGYICYAVANAVLVARQAMLCAQAVLYLKFLTAAAQYMSASSAETAIIFSPPMP